MSVDETILAAGEEEYEQLYSPSIGLVLLLSTFYGSISCLAIIGNMLVIWVITTSRQMRTITNMYIANLALADVVIATFCIPFQFQAALLQRWNLPRFMCPFCPFVQALTVNVSIFTLTAIAIDRHRAVVHPFKARPTRLFSQIVIVAIWIVAFVCALPFEIAFDVIVLHERIKGKHMGSRTKIAFVELLAENGLVHNVTRDFCTNVNLTDEQLQTYRYALVFVQYVVPFFIIAFVYIQMTLQLWSIRAPGNAQDLRDLNYARNKQKVIKMLIVVVAIFGLCWFPLQMYNVMHVTIPEINEYHYISVIFFCCDWLAMSNSCCNPFIYGIYNEKFKREFNQRFSGYCKFRTSVDLRERSVASLHTRTSSVSSNYGRVSMRILNSLRFSTGKGKRLTDRETIDLTTSNTAYSGNKQDLGLPRVSSARKNRGTSCNCNKNYSAQHGCEAARALSPPADAIQLTLLAEVDSPSSSNCICKLELGSNFECDGTCILGELPLSGDQTPIDLEFIE